jgi:hypothetical protein
MQATRSPARTPQSLQDRRPTIAAFEELFVGQTKRAIDDRLARGVEFARAPREIHRCEWCFHVGAFFS